ncbi:TetR/AcrR family transcriptional regulator [Pseudomonas gingeri]|uniref:TetR/AcrR family transcriptional regulator n=1 Tax=Pseudomonas gingeri TaxID=117681 RepID=UPI0015A42826|nr:TetR/AcrR family transcriptional regulator [Pseudomonas gingeri]NWA09216.1 TetR/AcrR family transcriptional regulator [Pseudomonas gingeri]
MKNGFGNAGRPTASSLKPRAKPLKRPSQARAIFTVEAIYQAFVRIWRRDGWKALTTRAVSLEAGVAVGTLYDYFPSKEALLSGYVRHSVERLLQQLDAQVIQPTDLDWRTRVERLIRLSGHPAAPDQPLFDYELLMLEHQIAEPKHHQRVFEELSRAWHQAFAACTDLAQPPTAGQVDAWLVLVWGGRRYCRLAQLSAAAMDNWLAQTQALVTRHLEAAT